MKGLFNLTGGTLLLGETVGVFQWLGALLLLAALVVYAWGESKQTSTVRGATADGGDTKPD